MGLGISLIGYFLVAFTCPTLSCQFSEPVFFGLSVTSISWILATICLFWYQTFDALDGMQCKKVDMYHSPMAELFDHGVDSITLVLFSLTSASAMSFGASIYSFLILFGAFLTFYAPTWEHIQTGVMRFQSGLVNPTEALCSIQALLLLTAFFPSTWTIHLIWGFQLRHFMVLMTFITSCISFLSSVSVVVSDYRQRNKSLVRSFLELTPPLLIGALGVIWFSFTPMTAFFINHPRIVLFTISFPFLYTICHVIAAEMTKSHLNLMDIWKAILPLSFCVLSRFVPFLLQWEAPIVYLSFLVGLIQYVLWVRQVIFSLCIHLGMDHWYSVPPFKKVE